MWYRLLDFVYVLALFCVCFTTTGMLIYAVWNIGQIALRGLHTFLTCFDYQCSGAEGRGFLLRHPVMRPILRLDSSLAAFAPWPFGRVRLMERLDAFRFQKACQENKALIWDPYLGALLTPDEHRHLYATEAT